MFIAMRSRLSIVRVTVSSLLVYLMIVLMWTPFVSAKTTVAAKTATAKQVQSAAPHRGNELLVKFRGGVSRRDKDTIMATQSARRKKLLKGDSGFEKLELPSGRDARAAAFELSLNPQVEFAEPNFVISKDEVNPNDPRFNEQWALRNVGQNGGQYGSDINAVKAWEANTGEPGTIIAVIDSGIDFNHPDLINNRWTNPHPTSSGDLHGWDYVTDNGEIVDEQGHGTAVAGIIAAEGNNSLGVSGVMWRANLMSLRVLDNTGNGSIADAVEAIDYAVTHGAHVINLSWGTTGNSVALKDAIQRALRRHVVVVCSAGNRSEDLNATPYYPAAYPLKDLISVAGVDNLDQLASWSNWGRQTVTVAAPGTNILTTQRGGSYWTVSGTSAAAPVVAGIAGLLKSKRPLASTRVIAKAIEDSARQTASLSGKVSSGGVVNAAGALAKLRGSDNQPPPPGNGGGGTGPGGGHSTTPPASTPGAPSANLPDLDQLRNKEPQQPTAEPPIQSNLPCADCDPLGGGGGGSFHPINDPNFSTARRQPINETGQAGVDLGSQNFNWSSPLLGLPGRAGLDLNLSLFYNSLVWTKDGTYMKFNADLGSPAPGFRLGLPVLQQRFLNSLTGAFAYMMVTPSGRRVDLKQVGTSNIYESQDSTYTQLDVTNPSAPVVRTTDGTRFTFVPVTINNEFRCTEIKDRNGNKITATYNTTNGHLLTLTDTLNRVITFVYDVDNNLQAIRQTWNGSAHDWATFNYGQVSVLPQFGGGLQVNGPNGNNVTVLTRVNLHDGSYFTFDYNAAFAQVKRINNYAADGHLRAYTSYNVSAATGQTECPRFDQRRDWAENWNSGNEAITNYTVTGASSTQVATPDGTIYKEFFATSGWQKGLTTSTEVWSGAVKKKWTTVTWTQDDTGLSFQKNARVIETNVYDEAGNRQRKVIDYGSYAQYGLPYWVKEYAADGTTELRHTFIDYNLSQAYLDRRIIGLPSQVHIKNAASYEAKTTYDYDDPARLQAVPAAATQHDTAYSTSLTTRGNVTAVSRWDVTDINNAAKKLITYTNYNTTGSTVLTTDPSGHQNSISYTDSFSDSVNRNTFAYPTTITDGDSFQTLSKYNYDFAAVTWMQRPSPNVGQTAPTQSITYDFAGRIQQITNGVNGAYVRWVYPTNGVTVQNYSTVVSGAGESYSVQIFDGAGRVLSEAMDNPGSTGLYRGVSYVYNDMGQLVKRSNPTEINSSWVPTGDDSTWIYTVQTYDWNGRPALTTLPDGATRENTYGGCGCAGGEVTTARDERGRRRKFTTDVLGRLKQVDELNFDQTVYATTTYTYSALDQVTQVNQAGQTRSSLFDGYGRLKKRTTPEQGETNYSYFADGNLQTITDARGATSTFSYNNRHLMTGITYGVPSGVAATPNVTFGYNAAGDRTSMTDGLGSASYVYDQLSRMTSETRTFAGVGSFTLSYAYNLGGELTSITNPWSAQVGYNYDKTGRPTSVSGSGYSGVSSYVNSIAYRAFGVKQMAYGNSRTLSVQYNNRLMPTQWNVSGVLGWNYNYQYLGENTGRVSYAQNINDGTLDRSFGYDHVGRLTASHTGIDARSHVGINPNGTPDGPYSQRYSYDQWGNITSREGWGGDNPSFTATYINNKRVGLTYDATGNLTNDGGQNFTYDATGQAATASYTGYLLQQFYDGDRLRVKKVEAETTYYLRSSVLGGQVVAEIAGNGDWARGYVYLGGQLLAVQHGGVYWVHQDPVVKSKRVTNSSGTVVSTVELDPWGGNTNRSNNGDFQPHKFNNYTRDANASDDAMFRRYNRWWSRFDQPDPSDGSYDLENPQTFNRFTYATNDPVNRVDPTGLDPCYDEDGNPVDCGPPVDPSDIVRTNTFAPHWIFGPYYIPASISGGTDITAVIFSPRRPMQTLLPVLSQQPTSPGVSEREKNVRDCLDREQAKIDGQRDKFNNDFGKRLLHSAGFGALRGAIGGGIAGGVAGGALFGVGAIPGAIIGATVGGITGAAGGVITGAFFIEPARRLAYHHFDYKGALDQAKKYCNAQY
ncbi:MAG TPA: S8 family serine peptidase [Pyrinomonadaceae bacterium]|nr:S8 family serine peptidase [Pyrinomonadaceae bacterium]